MPRTATLLLVSASLLAATALSACGGGDDAPSSQPAAQAPPAKTAKPSKRAVSAEIKDFAFLPADIKVKAGQTIHFENADAAPHTVTATSGADFDSGSLTQGAGFDVRTSKPGTIAFFCSIHPSMTGSITVE